MRRLLPRESFEHLVPALPAGSGPQAARDLFSPARVSDRSDGKIAHLDGLNLSRAWCWRLAGCSAMPEADPAKPHAINAAMSHLAAAIPHIAGDYMGEHWLATFALLGAGKRLSVAWPTGPSAHCLHSLTMPPNSLALRKFSRPRSGRESHPGSLSSCPTHCQRIEIKP
jgi:hypothetical protein